MFSVESRRFEGLPHRQWTPERMSFFLAFTDDEGVPRNVCSQHWTLTTVPVLSLIKTVSSCVVQIVCVITNQGSSNPNCLNFLKDAYKVYQGVPPTYWPCRTPGTVARPARGPFLQTNLFVVTNSTISFQVFFASLLAVVSAAACNSAGRWDQVRARCAHDVAIDEHAIRTRPRCCGFWNRVIAHAWKFPQAYGAFLVM